MSAFTYSPPKVALKPMLYGTDAKMYGQLIPFVVIAVGSFMKLWNSSMRMMVAAGILPSASTSPNVE